MNREQSRSDTAQEQRHQDDEALLVSVPEAARLLGIGLTFAWTMVRRGELPTIRLGRRVLVSRRVLEQLAGIDQHELGA